MIEKEKRDKTKEKRLDFRYIKIIEELITKLLF